MKAKIELLVQKIDSILKDENPSTDWLKGRYSAFRGIKKELIKILQVERETNSTDKGTDGDCGHKGTYVINDTIYCKKCREPLGIKLKTTDRKTLI